MKVEDRKKIAAHLERQGQQLIALANAINPDTPDEGDDSVLEQITGFIDTVEDSPLGMLPQVQAIGAVADAASLIGSLFGGKK